MKIECKVRIRKDGGFHEGDLDKLEIIPGNIVDVVLPDNPRGRALVTKEDNSGFGVGPILSNIAERPTTFHP